MRTMAACAKTTAVASAGIWDRCHEDLISPGSSMSALSMIARGPARPYRMPERWLSTARSARLRHLGPRPPPRLIVACVSAGTVN